MRRLSPLLVALMVLAVGCSSDEEPSAPEPRAGGACSAERQQPQDVAQVQRQEADLDGDGRSDALVSWTASGKRVVQVQLADGRTAAPEPAFSGDVLATPDLDGDGRAEVLAGTSEGKGGGFRLDGCRLVPIRFSGIERAWEFAVGPGARLTCRPDEVVEEAVTEGPETIRRAWRYTDPDVVGADPTGSGQVTEPGIDCA